MTWCRSKIYIVVNAGTAIVTDTKAALWTDGRYYLQAESQLDSNWTLMKDGEYWAGTATKELARVVVVMMTIMIVNLWIARHSYARYAQAICPSQKNGLVAEEVEPKVN